VRRSRNALLFNVEFANCSLSSPGLQAVSLQYLRMRIAIVVRRRAMTNGEWEEDRLASDVPSGNKRSPVGDSLRLSAPTTNKRSNVHRATFAVASAWVATKLELTFRSGPARVQRCDSTGQVPVFDIFKPSLAHERRKCLLIGKTRDRIWKVFVCSARTA
jgi:hypothetical protein